jgi:hypothetical protein
MTVAYPQTPDDSHNYLQQRSFPDLAAMRQAFDAQAAELEALATEHAETRRRLHILMVRTHNAMEALQSRGTPQAAISMALAELQDGREGK